MRALLDARYDLEKTLVHRFLDVVAAASAGDSSHSVIQYGGDRRFGILRQAHHLLEVARTQGGDEPVPQRAVTNGFAGQVHVSLDGDRYADYEDQGQRVQEQPAVLEEIDDRTHEIHLRAPKKYRPAPILDSTRFRKIGYDLLLTLLRRLPRCTILRRIRFHGLVIDHFPFELVTVDGRQRLVQQAVHG